MKFYTKSKICALALTLLTLSSACTKEIENRGYVTKFSNFSDIKIGQTDKTDILRMLGSPTTKSNLGKEKWIYLGVEETKETFFEPDVKSYQAYVISFNKQDVVSSITTRDKSHLNEIEISEDFTSTGGNEVTFMQQLLGNLGKFNPGAQRRSSR